MPHTGNISDTEIPILGIYSIKVYCRNPSKK